MAFEIRRLTPDMLEDYLYFFENVAHTDNKRWDRCYCVGYCSDTYDGADFTSAEIRREYAIRYVKGGYLQGYLAYSDNQVVGWCNANRKADCMKCGCWQVISKDSEKTESDAGTKAVFCFTVAPEMRGKGIATRLLERVCEDALHEGYAAVEAYPNKEHTDVYNDFVGPLSLYQKLGFETIGESEKRYIVRRKLN